MYSIHKKYTIYNIVVLLIVYINIIVLFASIYTVLDYTNLGPIVEHMTKEYPESTFDNRFFRSLYFSTITMLSVGYGDVTPYGWSRLIAMIESIIGGILPAALVIHFMFPLRYSQEERYQKSSTGNLL